MRRIAWIQTLVRQRKPTAHEPNPPPPTVMMRATGACECAHPKCPACQLSKQHRCSAKSQWVTVRPEREMAIKRDDIAPGDCISTDQHISETPGRLVHAQGRKSTDQQHSGGTIFIDHASGYICLHDQVSLRIGEVLQGKHHFEQFANEHGVALQSFRASDNCV